MIRVLAIDPGTVKCGLAIVQAGHFDPLFRAVLPVEQLFDQAKSAVREYAPEAVVLGSGTASRTIAEMLAALALPIHVVDEYGTTLAARGRYYVAFPARGWRRLIPLGLRLPPVALDDWAAVVMAERFLEAR